MTPSPALKAPFSAFVLHQVQGPHTHCVSGQGSPTRTPCVLGDQVVGSPLPGWSGPRGLPGSAPGWELGAPGWGSLQQQPPDVWVGRQECPLRLTVVWLDS